MHASAVSVDISACTPPTTYSMETAPISLSPVAGTPEGTPSLADKGAASAVVSGGDVGKFNPPGNGMVDRDVVPLAPMLEGPVVETREQIHVNGNFDTLSD